MKAKPKVAISYRVFRRSSRARRRVPVGRTWRNFADAMTALAGARRNFPDAQLTRTTVLIEVFS